MNYYWVREGNMFGIGLSKANLPKYVRKSETNNPSKLDVIIWCFKSIKKKAYFRSRMSQTNLFLSKLNRPNSVNKKIRCESVQSKNLSDWTILPSLTHILENSEMGEIPTAQWIKLNGRKRLRAKPEGYHWKKGEKQWWWLALGFYRQIGSFYELRAQRNPSY